MAECYTMLKQDKDAIAILDGIPSRQRTPKVSPCRFLSQVSVSLGQKIIYRFNGIMSFSSVKYCSVAFPNLKLANMGPFL